ncbi:hypothetical protein BC567DRAFT_263546 [Phyllosticta citribraziliensis]
MPSLPNTNTTAANSDAAAHNDQVTDMLSLMATVQKLRSGADEQSRVIADVKSQVDEMDRQAAQAQERLKADAEKMDDTK